MRKTTIQKLRAEADKLWQIKCQATSSKCLSCGARTQVGHHFFPKSIASSLRYDLENCVPLCNKCHFKLHNGDPTIGAKILKIKGIKWLAGLIKRRRKGIQITVQYFKDIIQWLKR